MAVGPGKYDNLCTYVREQAEARAAIVIILEGNQGQGFSCQAPLDVVVLLPSILRRIADEMETGGTN